MLSRLNRWANLGRLLTNMLSYKGRADEVNCLYGNNSSCNCAADR